MAEQITTAEDLDALPVGSVVVEGDHTTPDSFLGLACVETIPGVFHRFPDGWYVVAGYGAREVPLPARVLYRPDAALADHDRQVAERIVESLDRLAVVMRYDNDYPVRAVPWASVLDALAMARADTLAPAPGERCWCGGPIGPREPGDARGLGCLDNITHALAATPSETEDGR